MGFFFLPLLELKPNRLASGAPIHLLQLQDDLRYPFLFVLALAPLVLAYRQHVGSRGTLLAGTGTALLLLTLILPAWAGHALLEDPSTLLGEGANVRNPRVLPSGGLALGLVGAYMVVFAGVRDLARSGAGPWQRALAAWSGPVLIGALLLAGTFDVYSVLVEFEANGERLQQKFVEHLMFVSISLAVGFVVGVGLGLWAARDERISPMILYVVGIIQTIPSLALFGVLLVPLARLGDRGFVAMAVVFAASLGVAVVVAGLYRMLADREPPRLRAVHLLLSAVAAAVPLALFVGVLVSFLFRVANVGFASGRFTGTANLVGLLFLVGLAAWLVARFLLRKDASARLPVLWLSRAAYAGSLVALGLLFVRAAGTRSVLGSVDSLQELTVRDLGVSGIGVAPALVALTLYSLLPLVRNTYAGLNNVDAAIIDSGRGMGMTPAQRFFQIELPLAFPVIMAGVRNAGVALVGIGTIASVIGAGGLGDFVIQGIVNTSIDLILLGAIPAIGLALALDAGLRGVENVLTSPGIRQVQS